MGDEEVAFGIREAAFGAQHDRPSVHMNRAGRVDLESGHGIAVVVENMTRDQALRRHFDGDVLHVLASFDRKPLRIVGVEETLTVAFRADTRRARFPQIEICRHCRKPPSTACFRLQAPLVPFAEAPR